MPANRLQGPPRSAEVLPLDDSLRAMIMRRADAVDIKTRAVELGAASSDQRSNY
jgi:hypothetical protein